MKASEVIDKALTEVLTDPDKWTQHQMHDFYGRSCMAGSLQRAVGCSSLDGLTWATDDARHKHVLYAAARLGLLETLKVETGSPSMDIPRFNDADDRTFDEVRAMMEKARARMQEQGN